MAIKAIIFDLDGVLTHTAHLHAAAWKETFDAFLSRRAIATGTPFHPFTVPEDYRLFVDGRPRYEGVAAFLQSRGIELAWGAPDDPPGDATVCALGNTKNQRFQALLQEKGVAVSADAVAFVRAARRLGIKTAVATSSKNGRDVMAVANILPLFDWITDGEDAAKNHIQGKPAPDLFLYTAARLPAKPEETAVFEDAVVGIIAAKRGGFAPVIGVGAPGDALAEAGADLVIDRWTGLQFANDGGLVFKEVPEEGLPTSAADLPSVSPPP